MLQFISPETFLDIPVPACKQSEESPHSYLESDTVWINPAKPGVQGPHSLPFQDTSHSHLYINKICPPEYSELESHSSYRNMNHCTPSHVAKQGQYYASTSIMDRVHGCSEQGQHCQK